MPLSHVHVVHVPLPLVRRAPAARAHAYVSTQLA